LKVGISRTRRQPKGRFDMTAYTRQIAPTQFVEANGIRFAYRRFGKSGGVPLVFNQHLTGTMDHWDPAVTDGLARDRDLILFNNAGVSSSSGEVPATVQVMRCGSIHHGAGIAESRCARLFDWRLYCTGNRTSGPRSRQAPRFGRHRPAQWRRYGYPHAEAQEIFGAAYNEPDHLWLHVHFTQSEKSQTAGREFLKRFRLRAENCDPEVNEKAAPAQIEQSANGARRRRSHSHI
jgi:hypothetical protein